MYAENLQASLSPLLLISSCGLLLLAFYNRYITTISRLRAFDREILGETLNNASNRNQIMTMLSKQQDHINKRALLLKFAILVMLCSNFVSVLVPMVLLASDSVAALVLTYISLSLMGWAILLALGEMAISLTPVIEEEMMVRKISLVDITALNP
jgi:Protein of unknown function (DUF2721)